MCECELKLEALQAAIKLSKESGWRVDEIVGVAKKLYEFLKCADCDASQPSDIN